MKILMLSLHEEATGNRATAQRIGEHLQSGEHDVTHNSVREDTASILRIIEQQGIDAVIGVHAYGAGKHLRHCTVPTVIVFGGTDINEDVKDHERLALMTDAITRARALVTFHPEAAERIEQQWPLQRDSIHIIPQAAQVQPSNFSLRTHLALDADALLFLLPSGLRPVKDPLYLASIVTQWHAENPQVHLAIVGAERDRHFAETVREEAANSDALHVLPPLSQTNLHAAMREATAVVNSSKSESSPNSLLEAMALGAPVLVRNIPGNTAIVEHDETGLVFNTPEEWRTQAQKLVDDPALQTLLTTNATASIARDHSIEEERRAYRALVEELEHA